MSEETYMDKVPEMAWALRAIETNYGDKVSITNAQKALTKFGESESVGTSLTEISTLPSGVLTESLPTGSNTTTSLVSSSTSDTGTIRYEGHYFNSGKLHFYEGTATMNGRTPVVLDRALARVTRAISTSQDSMVGDLYFYEGGSVSAGVPQDDDEVHLILPAGQAQTQKCATSTAHDTYWILSSFTATVLEKTAASVQVRIEQKPATSTIWTPVTQYVGCHTYSGTTYTHFPQPKIIRANHDVRMVAIGSGANIQTAGGINGWLAI